VILPLQIWESDPAEISFFIDHSEGQPSGVWVTFLQGKGGVCISLSNLDKISRFFRRSFTNLHMDAHRTWIQGFRANHPTHVIREAALDLKSKHGETADSMSLTRSDQLLRDAPMRRERTLALWMEFKRFGW